MSSYPPPLPVSLPPSILSRSWLKQLTAWIRDDLDILVAREGPDVLRSDDVLVLHETFAALQHAQNISVRDLRATGIHRAVQDIAGTATRWPGRLCDECNTLIAIWKVKFGPLRNIRPFLFGRGGRLEGIASVSEYSGEELLKRWAATCPKDIHPKRTRRQGDLGFRPGAWWINPYFAYHAGIIGLESVEGGTTFDKHAAYALLLKDTVDIEAASLEQFTYRCTQNDKGRFRLTAATPRSRKPVRVLRSHVMNSIWGPKAGVRYEGLFAVQGWSIFTAKGSDIIGGEWKEGDIVYEVKFKRLDPVPITEVIKHPTAAELDDYLEYKRLRKAHRIEKQQIRTVPLIKSDRQLTPKISLVNQLTMPAGPTRVPSQTLASHSTSILRSISFKKLHFDEEAQGPSSPGLDIISPKNLSEVAQFNFAVAQKGRSTFPAKSTTQQFHTIESVSNDLSKGTTPGTSYESNSQLTGGTDTNIKDVAPWIDYEPGLSLPPADDQLHDREQTIDQKSRTKSMQSKGSIKSNQRTLAYGIHDSATSPIFGKRDSRKSFFVRPHHAGTRLLDGTREREKHRHLGRLSDYGFPSPRRISAGPNRWSWTDDLPDPFSTIRRNAISTGDDLTELFPRIPVFQEPRLSMTLSKASQGSEDCLDMPVAYLVPSLPLTLEELISHTSIAEPICSTISPHACTAHIESESNETLRPGQTSRNMTDNEKGPEIKVSFNNPFADSTPPKKESFGRDEHCCSGCCHLKN